MAFNGRSGHASAKQSLAKKRHERWLKNRSADDLLDQLVPKPPPKLDLEGSKGVPIRDVRRTKK